MSCFPRRLGDPVAEPTPQINNLDTVAVDGDSGPDLLTAGHVAAKDIGDLAIPLINVTGDKVGRHPDFENHCSSSIQHAIGGPTSALTSHWQGNTVCSG